MIDSGASISAVKLDTIRHMNLELTHCVESVNGIGGQLQTLGYVFINLSINGQSYNNKFYVLPDLPCATDGILGLDFLRKHKGYLDFEKNTLQLHSPSSDQVSLPINMGSSIYNNCITLSPRCESIHYVSVLMNEECVVSAKQLCDGVFLASAIVLPAQGKIPIKILNTRDEFVKLNFFIPELERLSNFNLCSFDKHTVDSDRVKSLFSALNLTHLNLEERKSIESLCAKFSDVFYLPGDKITTTSVYKQSISLKDNVKPIFTKPYRLPQTQTKEVQQQINKMLKQGIIEETKSEWSSPVLLVPKKLDATGEKKWRLVIDYRKINNCIDEDRFPLPNITEIIDSLAGSIYFSHLDLYQGYYSVELEQDSRKYTAFGSGQYQMTRMPMGLKTSPNAFSRMMTVAMTGLNYEKCLVYMDDLIIFGRNLQSHNKNLLDVFYRLRDVKLKLNPAKCDFLKKQILYLGHVVSDTGISPDPEKISVIKNYPVPTNADETRRFVAFANYYRKFIPNFAEKARPLNELNKKNSQFIWDTCCQNAFETLKNSLITSPVLQYPDFSNNNQFVLQTDASGYAIGAVLTNKDGRPVAYASRGLNKAEKNYATIEKELLAIVWAIKYFRPYLYGRSFKILTDHRPLIYLFNMRDPSSRLMKFRMIIEEYDFTIEYVRGKNNAAADALSRICITSDDLKEMNEKVVNVMTRSRYRQIIDNQQQDMTNMVSTNVWPDQPSVVDMHKKPLDGVEMRFIEEKQLKELRVLNKITNENNIFSYVPSKKTIFINPTSRAQITRAEFVGELGKFCKLINVDEIYLIKNNENGTFVEQITSQIRNIKNWSGPRLCIIKGVQRIFNKDTQRVILNDFHLLPTSGHAGIRRMTNNIKKYYFWPGIYRDVEQFVKRCDDCQKKKHSVPVKEPMVITTTAQTAFDKIFLDTVGPIYTDNNNYNYILTIQCELSKYVEAYPLASKSATEVARAFVNNFILRYGIPREIATDRGSEFISATMKEVCNLLNITQLNSTAYHHQSIGSLENTHKHLGAFLRIQTDSHPETWSSWLPYWCFSYNTSVHTETRYTPFELVYGKKCNLPSNILKSIDPLYNTDDYPLELKYRLQVSHKEAQQNLIRSKSIRKSKYDKYINPITYKPNDLVLVKMETGNKLENLYSGPYLVVKDEAPNVHIIKNGKTDIIHKNRTKLYYPNV